MQSQSFEIRQNGSVKSGTFRYTLTHDNKIIYSGHIVIGAWFFTKAEDTSGTYEVDPGLLMSGNFLVGKQFKIGPVNFSVDGFAEGYRTVGISVDGQNLSGVVLIDTTSPMIKIKKLTTQVRVPILGTLNITADPVNSWKRFLRWLPIQIISR